MNKRFALSGKTARNDFVTYGMVVVLFVVVEILVHTGLLNSQMQGLLVPICVYCTMAVSLNLVVGVLGELSLGHAGFMCIGAFVSAFFSKSDSSARFQSKGTCPRSFINSSLMLNIESPFIFNETFYRAPRCI